jgi:Ca2+:H+ antiporter
MGIAIGSSIQIGLLAIPLATLVGWATGHPFSLAFDPFSALTLVLSVIHTTVMIADAQSNWLEGMQVGELVGWEGRRQGRGGGAR